MLGVFFCENVVHCPYLLGNILEIESWKLDLNWNKIWGIFTRASLVCLTVDTRGELFFHSSFAFIPNWPLGILPWKLFLTERSVLVLSFIPFNRSTASMKRFEKFTISFSCFLWFEFQAITTKFRRWRMRAPF